MIRFPLHPRPRRSFHTAGPLVVLTLVICAGSVINVPPAPEARPRPDQPAAATEQEELLGEASAEAKGDPVLARVAPDQRSVLWFEHHGDRMVAKLNGRPFGAEFDWRATPYPVVQFRDGTRHVAVQGTRAKKKVIIVDGRDLSAGFDEVSGMALNGDGGAIAFGAKTGKDWVLMVNAERRAGPFATCPMAVFSPDGAHLAYSAKRGSAWVVAVDGKEQGAEADEVLGLYVSASGRVDYAARKKLGYFYVIDGKPEKSFNVLGPLVHSPDGQRHAYGGAEIKIRLGYERAVGQLVVDGRPGPGHDGVPIGNSAFSTVRIARGWLPRLYSLVDGVSDPVFSPDGQNVAHIVRASSTKVTAFLDDRPVGTFDTAFLASVSLLTAAPVLSFSPDGAHLAVVGARGEARGDTLVELRDGAVVAEQTTEDDVELLEQLVWSPDGRRTAFVVGQDPNVFPDRGMIVAHRRVVVDGKPGPEAECGGVIGPMFSADSRHWAYAIVNAEERGSASFVVLDGVEGRAYSWVYSLQFAGDTAVYVARDGRRFVRVTRALPVGLGKTSPPAR